jgi:hypothetical protein
MKLPIMYLGNEEKHENLRIVGVLADIAMGNLQSTS